MDGTDECHYLCFTDVDAIPVVCNRCPSSSSCLVQDEAKTSSFRLRSPLTLNDSVGCLTSCKATTSDATRVSAEQFLFGGFEMTTNAKSVELFVCDDQSDKETYLTTSRGVPQRDLPPISVGETTEVGPAESEGQSVEDREGSSERTQTPSERGLLFYKFVLVCPGGPRPLIKLKLKFSKQSEEAKIIVRTLKIKGKLAAAKPSSKKPPANMIGMPSMMAMMQQHSGLVPSPMAPMEQGKREQDMRQAEILSSIVGLSMTMRSSEERSMRRLEEMESRIMSRLDEMADRIGAIEQYYASRGTSDASGTEAADKEGNATNGKSK